MSAAEPRRGGWRQRRAQDEAELRNRSRSRSRLRVAREAPSEQVAVLLESWALGKLCPRVLHLQMAAQLRDAEKLVSANSAPVVNDQVRRIAAIGGRRPTYSNCHRDVLKMVTKDLLVMCR